MDATIDTGSIAAAEYDSSSYSNTTERNFEDDVERFMHDARWRTSYGEGMSRTENIAASQAGYDRKLALKVDSLIGFIRETQPQEWAKIERQYGALARDRFLKRLCDELEPHQDRGGVINVLRRGIKMAPGAQFKLCFFAPPPRKTRMPGSAIAPTALNLCASCATGPCRAARTTPWTWCSFLMASPWSPWSSRTTSPASGPIHAVVQYKRDRNPREVLFKPNRRAIVHFALDSETVEMCTWLAGDASHFLPFNKGNGMNGAGNPANPNGYRTEYLYREILSPDSLLDIIQRFARVDYDPETRAMKRIIFPRFHQLDAVRRLVADAREHGAGKSYLIQHSAGSGKSNSIAWLAHHLQSLHDACDNPVFDTVVILTDRRNLDTQLSQTIESVDHKRGVVVRVREQDGSAGLRGAINSGAQIITSTIQKFPYICSETKVSGKKFAVIIDEAHSSQSGKANAKMKMALIDRDVDPDEPWDDEDELVREMRAQGTIPNLSFFAFTATPKAATLEVFGTRDEQCRRDESGMLIPRPFHLYSMKQAIDEGFIHDVLENYTCFESYFEARQDHRRRPQVQGSEGQPRAHGDRGLESRDGGQEGRDHRRALHARCRGRAGRALQGNGGYMEPSHGVPPLPRHDGVHQAPGLRLPGDGRLLRQPRRGR